MDGFFSTNGLASSIWGYSSVLILLNCIVLTCLDRFGKMLLGKAPVVHSWNKVANFPIWVSRFFIEDEWFYNVKTFIWMYDMNMSSSKGLFLWTYSFLYMYRFIFCVYDMNFSSSEGFLLSCWKFYDLVAPWLLVHEKLGWLLKSILCVFEYRLLDT